MIIGDEFLRSRVIKALERFMYQRSRVEIIDSEFPEELSGPAVGNAVGTGRNIFMNTDRERGYLTGQAVEP